MSVWRGRSRRGHHVSVARVKAPLRGRIIWTSAVLLLITLFIPATTTARGQDILAATQHFLLKYAGVLALVALTTAVGVGVVATDRIVMVPGTRVVAQAVHRAVSLGALLFLVVHIVVEIAAHRSHLIDSVVPFMAHGRRFYIGLGTIASDLIILLVVTGIARGRFAARWPWAWRMIHATAYLCWPLAIIHGLLAGRAAKPYVDWSYGACVALVALALGIRFVATIRAKNDTIGAPVPDRASAAMAGALPALAMESFASQRAGLRGRAHRAQGPPGRHRQRADRRRAHSAAGPGAAPGPARAPGRAVEPARRSGAVRGAAPHDRDEPARRAGPIRCDGPLRCGGPSGWCGPTHGTEPPTRTQPRWRGEPVPGREPCHPAEPGPGRRLARGALRRRIAHRPDHRAAARRRAVRGAATTGRVPPQRSPCDAASPQRPASDTVPRQRLSPGATAPQRPPPGATAPQRPPPDTVAPQRPPPGATAPQRPPPDTVARQRLPSGAVLSGWPGRWVLPGRPLSRRQPGRGASRRSVLPRPSVSRDDLPG